MSMLPASTWLAILLAFLLVRYGTSWSRGGEPLVRVHHTDPRKPLANQVKERTVTAPIAKMKPIVWRSASDMAALHVAHTKSAFVSLEITSHLLPLTREWRVRLRQVHAELEVQERAQVARLGRARDAGLGVVHHQRVRVRE